MCRNLISAAVLALSLATLPLHAAEDVVWKMGEPDRSDHEFKGTLSAFAGQPVVVRVDGHEMSHWPKIHPGSGNGAYGGIAHPYTLIFDLAGPASQGTYYLDVSLLFRQPRTPALDVEINGRRGRFYFDPELIFGIDNVDDEFNPIRSWARRRLALPAICFRPGENRLTLTAVDEPQVVVHNQTTGGGGDSGFCYDALCLTHDADAAPVGNLGVFFSPTVLFPKTRGVVSEQCRLTVQFTNGWPGGRARLTIGSFTANFQTPAPGGFGEGRYTVLVPGDLPSGEGRVELSPNGDFAAPESRSFNIHFAPARKWKVFYAPNEHMDVGFTDYRAKVAEGFARNMDSLLKAFEANPHYRFNVDGGWVIEQWLRLRTDRDTAPLAAQAAAGRLAVNAFYSCPATEYPSLEESFRNLYYGKELQERFGVPFDLALITDVPSASWSTPSILAAAGVKYFAEGINQDRAPILAGGHWNARSPFWWEGPDGGRVLAWFSAHYHQVKSLFGLPPEMQSAQSGLARFLQTYEQPAYAPDAVLIYGTQVENHPMPYEDAAFVERWNAEFAWPQLIACRFADFFRYIDEHYGAGLPVVKGTGGAYWADNFGIMAGATARDRANQSRAITAETVSTLTAALRPELRFDRELDHQIWRDNMLYAEHNFGTGRTATQPERQEVAGVLAEKEQFTLDAQWAIDKMLRIGLSQLADQIQTEGQNFIVFNPLSWKRSGLVQVQLDDTACLTNLVTGRRVEWEVVGAKDGYQTARFWVEDIPAIGYRVYRLGRGPKANAAASLPDHGNVVENRFYRITLDPARAAIKSIFDKELGRELADASSPYGLNEYLFVSGGGTEAGRGAGLEDSLLLHPFPWLPPAKLEIHQAVQGTLAGAEQTPWGWRIRMTASAAHTPRIETEILLPNEAKRIEIRDTFDVECLYAKQASYVAFPWAVSNATFRYDIPNGFVNPAADLLEGGCSDWFCVQHVVNTANSAVSVDLAVVDAPLVTLGDINRGRWLPRFTNDSSTVFSWALNNYWSPKWAGKKSDRLVCSYAITSGARFDAARSSRFGREARAVLETAELKNSDKLPGAPGTLPRAEAGFVSLAPENVVLTAFKPAEDGGDLIVRVLETSGQGGGAVLNLPFLRLASARKADAVETPGEPLQSGTNSVRFHIGPYQAVTLRLSLSQGE